MQDTAGRFARQFAKAMRKAGRQDVEHPIGAVEDRFDVHAYLRSAPSGRSFVMSE